MRHNCRHCHDSICLLILLFLATLLLVSGRLFIGSVSLALASDLDLLHILLLLAARFLLLHMLILKHQLHSLRIVVCDVSYTLPALPNELLQTKIVRGCQAIVPVHLNLTLSLGS